MSFLPSIASEGNEGTEKSMVYSPTFPSKIGGTSNVDLPFEFRVLETCQKFVCKCLESEASTLEQEAYPALDELSISVCTRNLQRIRIIKSHLVAPEGLTWLPVCGFSALEFVCSNRK